MDRFIAAELVHYKVPGAAVAIVRDGKVLLSKGYGYRDLAAKAPVDGDTIFQLASVTKALTGTLAGTLADEGKLDFDKPVYNYLPQFVHYDPYIARQLTTRDLLAHRTGWPAFGGDVLSSFGYSPEEVVRRLRYFQPTHSLREVASYSNPAYFLAGQVEAAVGGGTWNDLIGSRLYAPLNMKRSGTRFVVPGDGNVSKNYAFVEGKLIEVPPLDDNMSYASGGAISTVSDLANWMRMLLEGGSFGQARLLKPETVKELFKRSMVAEPSIAEMPPISDQTGFYFVMGFGSYDYANVQVIEKSGAIAGVRTSVVLVPEKRPESSSSPTSISPPSPRPSAPNGSPSF